MDFFVRIVLLLFNVYFISALKAVEDLILCRLAYVASPHLGFYLVDRFRWRSITGKVMRRPGQRGITFRRHPVLAL